MRLNNRIALGGLLLLAGCGGRGGQDGAPRLAPPMVDDGGGQGGYGPPPVAQRAPDPRDYPPPDPSYPPPAYPPAMPADAPPDLPRGAGPNATSGQERYDAVGYAGIDGDETGGRAANGQRLDPGAVTVAHRSLPLGAVVEVTALDSGHTILAVVGDRGPESAARLIDLSQGAAQALGGAGGIVPVRVRLVTPAPADQVALRQGRAASPRIDAPPALLVALRRRLPGRGAMAAPPPPPPRPGRAPSYAPPPAPSYAPPPAPYRRETAASPAAGGFYVQVAALSDGARARALATSLHGRIERAGAIFRVQIGPFADERSAQRARDDVARRGYGDARVLRTR